MGYQRYQVVRGMYLAAWARAELCGLNIVAGRLEPHCKYEPSDALWAAFGAGQGAIIGVMGFGVPILRWDVEKDDDGEVLRERACAASWPLYWERN